MIQVAQLVLKVNINECIPEIYADGYKERN